MAKLRTFIAVEVTSAIRQQAEGLVDQLSRTEANVKWVDGFDMHWTVKFLGEVSSRDSIDVCRAMKRAAKQVTPFSIVASGAGAFPAADRPRTVWLGVGEGQEAFIELHDLLEEELADIGYRSERRRFQPHITLGRVRRSPRGVDELGGLITEQAEFDAGRMEVSELVLFSSRLLRDGPEYDVLAKVPLGKGK